MEELEEHAMGCQVREFHKSTFWCYDVGLLRIFNLRVLVIVLTIVL